ncbi:MAG: helix-turn-helix transcriptional regulator [Butyrivibrio sp.]|nr:helix-turn-helix transcriptional regulator [Butyrivibrio sp.]
MNLGKNIRYLRKQKKITQEGFAEHMAVSRQTVTKWESGDAVPELDKLVEICEFFSCKLDELVRKNLTENENIYSEVRIETVPPFKMARYVMISPQPENDVNTYLERWAADSGLLAFDKNAKRIGWDFPYVSSEQKNRFGLQGYVAAYILPQDFEAAYPGVEIAEQKEADYAVISIREPFKNAFERIPNAYKIIMRYLGAKGFKEKPEDNILSYYEYVYDKDGITYMDVFVHVNAVTGGILHTDFS